MCRSVEAVGGAESRLLPVLLQVAGCQGELVTPRGTVTRCICCTSRPSCIVLRTCPAGMVNTADLRVAEAEGVDGAVGSAGGVVQQRARQRGKCAVAGAGVVQMQSCLPGAQMRLAAGGGGGRAS